MCRLRTSLCLQFKPHHIAAGAIFLAAKFLKVKLPSDGEKVWWQEFDVTPRQLEGWCPFFPVLVIKRKEKQKYYLMVISFFFPSSKSCWLFLSLVWCYLSKNLIVQLFVCVGAIKLIVNII